MKAVSVALFAGMVGHVIVQPAWAGEPAKAKEKVLYSFCSQANCTDGDDPGAGLIMGSSGNPYGTTEYGGTNCEDNGVAGCGTVFSVNPTTGAETVLYSFCSQQNCTDGSHPRASLIDVNGTLYGTTGAGGTGCDGSGCGVVFSLDPKGGAETVLYSFCSQQNCTDGQGPHASLIDVKGTLYGTTYYGGQNDGNAYCEDGCGTVFSVDPNTSTETVLYSLCGKNNCADGANPEANLIDVKGTLYGTTSQGDTGNCPEQGNGNGCGTVFAINANSGKEKVIYSFSKVPDASIPIAGLLDVKGTLYGTTPAGGANCVSNGGCGTVFLLKKP
jgi:uncharacterized repeat protein (TIGR03803 family)